MSGLPVIMELRKLREAELNGVHVEMCNDPEFGRKWRTSILHPIEKE
jgi:hypothetical protein